MQINHIMLDKLNNTPHPPSKSNSNYSISDNDNDNEEIAFEEEDDYDKWEFNMIRQDDVQFKKWVKYFRPRLTMDQIRTSDMLRVMPNVYSLTKHLDYIVLFQKNEQLMKTWKEEKKQRNIWKGRRVNLYIDVLNTIDDGIIGFNFFNENIRRTLQLLGQNPSKRALKKFQEEANVPFMTSGGFYGKYAHTIPALFLHHHLQMLRNEHIDFHVVCQGFKFKGHRNLIGYEQYYNTSSSEYDLISTMNYDEQIQRMLNSKTVKSIRQNPIDVKRHTIRRICFWMQTEAHVFIVCWDEFAIPNCFHHVLSIIDNLYPESMIEEDLFCRAFEKAIRLVEGKEEKNASDSDGSDQSEETVFIQWFNTNWTWLVPVEKDFICVSFMARCTLYLSMFEGALLERTIIPKLVDNQPLLEHLQMIYRQFELDVYHFTSHKVAQGYIILFPSTLNTQYLEVNQITLMTMDAHGNCKEYRYHGMKYKFKSVDWKPPSQGEDFGCYISSAASL